jgi:hypothetical protein
MNQFELAKLKGEKLHKRNMEYQQRQQQRQSLQESEVKEEEKPVVKKPEPMTLLISGPVEMTLLVDYQGTLTTGQQQEKELRALFVKCLKPIGRVRDAD